MVRLKYAALFTLLFLIELGIALYVHDGFVRPFLGDTLVVILIYFFCQIFLLRPALRVSLGVLAFAFTVEFLQAVDVVALLGLQQHVWLSIAIGRTFSWSDLLAYSVGSALTSLDPWAPKLVNEC